METTRFREIDRNPQIGVPIFNVTDIFSSFVSLLSLSSDLDDDDDDG